MARETGRAPAGVDPGSDDAVGRAVALLALESIARQGADRRVREETEQREEEETARRAEIRAQLGRTAKREWWFFVAWNLTWALILLPISLPLTFAATNADLLVAFEAAVHYQWISLLVAAGIVLVASVAYNVERFRGGKPPPAEADIADYMLLGLLLPGVFLFSAGQDGAVPPSAWSFAPLVPAAALLVAFLTRLVRERFARPDLGKLSTLMTVVFVLGLAWLLAPRSDVPSAESQATTDRVLASAFPRARCGGRPIAALPAGLFRNSLDGLVRCRRHSIRGRVMAFRNAVLLNVFMSQREESLRASAERVGRGCRRSTEVAIRTWNDHFDNSYPIGQVLCYGSGVTATIEWSDTRTSTFAKFRGRSRASLFRWWRRHSWALHRRAIRAGARAVSTAG